MPTTPEESPEIPALLPWLALVIAFSPVLADLGAHLLANAWARYALWFPLLLARCSGARREPSEARLAGTLLLLVGLGLELFGIFAGTTRLGRIGLILGVIGVGLRFGLSSPRALLLSAFAIPVPAAVMRAVSPDLPEALLSAAVEAVGAVGVDAVREGRHVFVGDRGLRVEFFDSGLPVAALLAGISWYHSARAQVAWPRAVARACVAAPLALPLQVVMLGIAVIGLALGIDTAGAWTAHVPWLVVAPLGIAATEIALRREHSAS